MCGHDASQRAFALSAAAQTLATYLQFTDANLDEMFDVVNDLFRELLGKLRPMSVEDGLQLRSMITALYIPVTNSNSSSTCIALYASLAN